MRASSLNLLIFYYYFIITDLIVIMYNTFSRNINFCFDIIRKFFFASPF